MGQYNKISWKYIAGFYDGEGTIGIRVVKEKRLDRMQSETMGWYVSPYIQLANTHEGVIEEIKNFFVENDILSTSVKIKYTTRPNNQDGYYLSIQSWNGIKKFIDYVKKYTIIKESQLKIFIELYKLRENLSTLKNGTKIDNLKKRYWDKKSFLEAMRLRDELKNTKLRRRAVHKYNLQYFENLFGSRPKRKQKIGVGNTYQ